MFCSMIRYEARLIAAIYSKLLHDNSAEITAGLKSHLLHISHSYGLSLLIDFLMPCYSVLIAVRNGLGYFFAYKILRLVWDQWSDFHV